jgi:hypothetical protein
VYLAAEYNGQGSALRKISHLSVALVIIWLAILAAFSPIASAAPAVFYSISPATGSVRPNETVNILLSFRTDVNLAGASVHLGFTNGSYAGFQSANSSALSFVDYHTNQNDILFICNNNNCAPGLYQVATITVSASQAGNLAVSFTPKETANTQLELIEASGISGSYNVLATAPASPAKRSQNTFTIPKDNGTGGMTPLQITGEQLTEQLDEAEKINESTSQDNNDTFWTPLNLVLLGIGVGIGFAACTFLVFKSFGNRRRLKGPRGPIGPGGNGPTYIVG